MNKNLLEREEFKRGPLSSLHVYFFDWLTNKAFADTTMGRHLNNGAHLSWYLEEQGIDDAAGWNSEHLRDFVEKHPKECQCRRDQHGGFAKKEVGSSMSRLVEFLKETGRWDEEKEEDSSDMILGEYQDWLTDYKGVAPTTLEKRSFYLKVFLERMEAAEVALVEGLTGEPIQKLFLEYAQGKGGGARRSMQSTLRTFFRFCVAKDYLRDDLSTAIPSLRTYRLNKVPGGIEDDKLQKVMSEINQETRSGMRDAAILEILYNYGCRGGQVRGLCLEDIDWRSSQIRFAPLKNGKEIVVPLSHQVGEKLLVYLEKARPHSRCREVFLTINAPHHRLEHNSLSAVVRRRFKASGIKAARMGTHVFRHSFATRLLAQGESLKTIADLLGHRDLQTTTQYTLVDFQALGKVAMDWGEVN